MAYDHPAQGEELNAPEAREPGVEDLVDLCRRLNDARANYVVIGGFAMRAMGISRHTMDVDLLIETGPENETRVFAALEGLPDKAVRELKPGEVAEYSVVRVADEIVVDLMKSACGIGYAEAAEDAVIREVGGVPIPFASPQMLWRMKQPTGRAKDAPDLLFLRYWFEARGQQPPEC